MDTDTLGLLVTVLAAGVAGYVGYKNNWEWGAMNAYKYLIVGGAGIIYLLGYALINGIKL